MTVTKGRMIEIADQVVNSCAENDYNDKNITHMLYIALSLLEEAGGTSTEDFLKLYKVLNKPGDMPNKDTGIPRGSAH